MSTLTIGRPSPPGRIFDVDLHIPLVWGDYVGVRACAYPQCGETAGGTFDVDLHILLVRGDYVGVRACAYPQCGETVTVLGGSLMLICVYFSYGVIMSVCGGNL